MQPEGGVLHNLKYFLILYFVKSLRLRHYKIYKVMGDRVSSLGIRRIDTYNNLRELFVSDIKRYLLYHYAWLPWSFVKMLTLDESVERNMKSYSK